MTSLPVAVLHNTDYDAELTAAVDVSAVLVAAEAVAAGLRHAGFSPRLVGVQGADLFEVVQALQGAGAAIVFNLCESLAGDARNEVAMTAVLDLFGQRYTGSDALALGSCLHKDRCKAILRGHGVATPPGACLATEGDLALVEDYSRPWFLKLAHEDASVGIDTSNVVHTAAALRARVLALWDGYRQPVIAEHFIAGREVNVTILGAGASARVLPLHEIDFSKMPAGRPNIVSYAAKWDESHEEYGGTTPVPLQGVSAATRDAIERTALAAYRALGLRDYGRVDLRLDDGQVPWVIDVNPNCDISPDAGVARAALAGGLDYPALLKHIVESAIARYEARPA
ncbi:MAG: D-alanine--D-alanine ligase [Myxococcales bacterium]|nr:D-alanine--D-alanine ligase [Myxococcales bacterium]